MATVGLPTVEIRGDVRQVVARGLPGRTRACRADPRPRSHRTDPLRAGAVRRDLPGRRRPAVGGWVAAVRDATSSTYGRTSGPSGVSVTPPSPACVSVSASCALRSAPKSTTSNVAVGMTSVRRTPRSVSMMKTWVVGSKVTKSRCLQPRNSRRRNSRTRSTFASSNKAHCGRRCSATSRTMGAGHMPAAGPMCSQSCTRPPETDRHDGTYFAAGSSWTLADLFAGERAPASCSASRTLPRYQAVARKRANGSSVLTASYSTSGVACEAVDVQRVLSEAARPPSRSGETTSSGGSSRRPGMTCRQRARASSARPAELSGSVIAHISETLCPNRLTRCGLACLVGLNSSLAPS